MRTLCLLMIALFIFSAAEAMGAECNGQKDAAPLARASLPAIEAPGVTSSETLILQNHHFPAQDDLPERADAESHFHDLLYRIEEDVQAYLLPGLQSGRRRDLLYRDREDEREHRLLQPEARPDYPSERVLGLNR